MKDRGKRTAMDYYSELSCQKHPSVSVVGICQYCLNDRLVNLVCSECGEQRLSSCSCSDDSPNRISFLIDEVKKQRKPTKTEEVTRTEEAVVFKRSSSSCVEMKQRKHHRFSRLGRLFRKINPRKERAFDDKNNNDDNDYGVLKQSVSRSRSLCSFRGGNGYFIGSEEDASSYSGARSSFSAARSSSVNGGLGVFETEHRRSNFEGRKSNFSEKSNFEGRRSNFSETTEQRRSNFSESEPPRRSGFEARKSNFSETEYQTEYKQSIRRSNYEGSLRKSDSSTRRVLSMKESYFTGGEEFGFIDLKFDSGGGGEVVLNDGVLERGGGGSCRLTKKDREVSKSRRSFKGWKWIFGHHLHQRDS